MSEEGERADEHEPPPLIGVIGLLAGIALLAVLVLTIEPLRTGIGDAVSGDTAQLRGDLRGLGVGGVVITLILALAHVVIWYPTEILNTAVGYVYGFWGGLLLVSIGWLGNAILAYWVGKHAAGQSSTGSSVAIASIDSSTWSSRAGCRCCSGCASSPWCRSASSRSWRAPRTHPWGPTCGPAWSATCR